MSAPSLPRRPRRRARPRRAGLYLGCAALLLAGERRRGSGALEACVPSPPPPPPPRAAPRCGGRRRALLAGSAAAVCDAGGGAGGRAAAAAEPREVSLPLSFERGAFYLDYLVEGERFRGVLDTGSPFALVSACTGERRRQGRCEEYCVRYGCSSPAAGLPAGLADNFVVFSGARTMAVWRRGRVELGGVGLEDVRFGVLSEVQSYGGNAGGPNFGLIRTATDDPAIRPTFLGQTPYTAFVVDLRPDRGARLELLAAPPGDAPRLPQAAMVDLRPFGAPVAYYALRVKELLFDGVNALSTGRPVVAILDTGTTGLALPQDLFDSYDRARRAAATRAAAAAASGVRPRSGASYGNVEVVVGGGAAQEDMRLSLRRGPVAQYDGARFDVVTSIPADAGGIFYRAEQRRPDVARPAVVFVGLGFLLGRRLYVDAAAGAVALSS